MWRIHLTLNRSKNLTAVKLQMHLLSTGVAVLVISPYFCVAAKGVMQTYPGEHERAYFAQIKADRIISTKAFPNIDLTQCFPSEFYFWNNFSAVVSKLQYFTRICRRLVLKTGVSFCVFCVMQASRERARQRRSCCTYACHLQCWLWLLVNSVLLSESKEKLSPSVTAHLCVHF